MSEMSEVNIIHVLGMCGKSEKDKADAQVNVLGKCRTSRAFVGCPQVNWGLNVWMQCMFQGCAESPKNTTAVFI